ncbi:MAG: hypothetical protein U0934_14020 [Pseudotabrizicola sp.]|uniref:hypothetical protein n=1 Tax=Pseudotabrizicola sp. TaxID=2939647 RepID=UPI002731E5CF|nr:hypothetical protein [Pseudotabrizicola sp.]MDP2083531.1 hypothetical protein [Pseudotabrizicola sp.]MDZ7575051.1 hypothetical protein [Pseudotabrizicola sp.]
MSADIAPGPGPLTASGGHDWITLHRLRFPDAISVHDRTFPPVSGALVWRFCPQHTPGEHGLVTLTSDIWGSRAEAEAMLDDPGAAMPWLSETANAWHCLAIPVAHRSQVNWRGHVEDGTAIRPSAADPGGPLVVVTTAGFLSRDADMLPRIRLFVEGVAEVMAWYGALPSNLHNDVFNGPDGREGFTCSLWRSDEAMREAAYHHGRHRARMDESRAGLMFDYSSFTRLRALRSHGDWDGNPFASTSLKTSEETTQ